MLKGVPVEQTINDCDDYIMFQKICKLSNKFDAVEHNGKRYTNKCYRVYASINDTDNSVRRVKGRSYNKFGNTPEHAYIENGNVLDMKIPQKLDKQWYIDLANTRLEQFGIGGQYGRTI